MKIASGSKHPYEAPSLDIIELRFSDIITDSTLGDEVGSNIDAGGWT